MSGNDMGAGRGVRLAALSLTGGAAITLLGGGVAHAGDAEATGNVSDTGQAQNLQVTPEADPTIVTMDGAVANAGAAGANTGVNGSAEDDLRTGNARSTGNEAHSRLDQSAAASASGGGITLIDQDAAIINAGAALADTGFNTGADTSTGDATAWGNRSWTSVVQRAMVSDASGVARFVRQASLSDNLGAALAETGWNDGDNITTGNASAGGNDARSEVLQDGTVTGEELGTVIVEQIDRLRNRGGAVANTGVNTTGQDDQTSDPEEE